MVVVEIKNNERKPLTEKGRTTMTAALPRQGRYDHAVYL